MIAACTATATEAQAHRGTQAQGHTGTGAQGHRGTGTRTGTVISVSMSDQLNTVLAFTVASSVRYTGPQGPVRVPLYSLSTARGRVRNRCRPLTRYVSGRDDKLVWTVPQLGGGNSVQLCATLPRPAQPTLLARRLPRCCFPRRIYLQSAVQVGGAVTHKLADDVLLLSGR